MMNYSNSGKNWKKKMNGSRTGSYRQEYVSTEFRFSFKKQSSNYRRKKKKNLTDCEIKLNLIQNRNFLFHFSIVDNQIHRRSSDQIVSGDG